MQLGHSKDHRPDLAQVKLMAAAAEPTGQWIACDVVSGEQADDPLYTPLIQRVREIIGRRGVLYTGDCKMAALATRAELVQQGDYYVTSLPMIGAVGQQFDTWVDAAVTGDQVATLIWQEKTLLGAGYEFVRSMMSEIADQPVTWNERILVFRSLTLAQSQATALEERLQRATADIEKLTPAPGRGRRQHTTEESLVTAFQQALSSHKVEGSLTITYQKEEESNIRWLGADAVVQIVRQRPSPRCAMLSRMYNATIRPSVPSKIVWAGEFWSPIWRKNRCLSARRSVIIVTHPLWKTPSTCSKTVRSASARSMSATMTRLPA
jgi:transposase